MPHSDDDIARISGNAVADLLLAHEDERNDLFQRSIDPLTLEETFVVAGQVISQLCDVVDAMTARPEVQAELVVRLNLIKDQLGSPPDGPPGG